VPIRQDKNGYWHAEACISGKRLHRRLPKGATARDAKRICNELIQHLSTNTNKSFAKNGDPYLTDLLAIYTTSHALSLRSPETAKYHAYRIGQWIVGKKASEVRKVAAQIRDDLLKAYKPATVNRSLGTLKKSLSMAFESGLTEIDYSGLVKRIPENNARTTHISMEQAQAIADCASEPVKAAIWLSLLTGMRRGEIMSLKKSDIGPSEITLKSGNTKTLKTRSIPIIAAARPWLEHIPISITTEGLKSGFERARIKSGLTHVTFHDLRRSCGTLLIQNGVPLHIVSRILGHSSTTVTEKVYAHLSSEQIRQGLEILGNLHTIYTQTVNKKA